MSYSVKNQILTSSEASYKYLLLAGFVLVLAGCSVEKNTDTTRFYHSLTARYNIYFNGYESYKSGITKISNGHRDDYGDIINVFEYSDPSSARLGSSDMETAIQKASKLISLKSITAKPEMDNRREISERDRRLLDRKEYNEWVDDSYLLIGKARFHKHEFPDAEAVFSYCINEANDPLIVKEANIWLARLKTETKDYVVAGRYLNDFEINDEMPQSLRAMYYTTLADLMIRQKRFSDASDPLLKAIELVKGKKNRYRLTYLLAQVYEQQGNSQLASTYYRKVAGMNPPYEVEFNARINIAGVFDVNSGSPAELKRELNKMRRDAKNKEFEDQIYFALGNIAMKEGNDAEALDYYRKSASASSGNQNQKGRSYLAMSEYYYKKAEYIKAGMYLDSTVYFLDQSHPQYSNLRTKSQNLNQLISQLVIIEREDSLQRVASLPQAQRDQVINDIITRVTQAESQGTSTDYEDRYNIGQYYENERRFQGNIEQEGKWYFYNQAALTFGRTEFRRRWGDRRLEDNWRRNNKTRVANTQELSEGEETTGETGRDTSTVAADNKKPEFYLKDLPLTDSLLKISNEKVAIALLKAGKAYAQNIQDTVRSTETYEALLTRYPESPVIPEALYDLYRVNSPVNKLKSEAYRQRLIERFPESEFAKILSDPDYYRTRLAEMKTTEIYYEEAYNLYSKEDFTGSIAKITETMKIYPENALSAKFMLLHAYSIARLEDERAFRDGLKLLIAAYPDTPESDKAKELLEYVKEQVPEIKIEEEKVAAAGLYVADTTDTRTFVLIISDPSFNVNQATFDVISYNIDYYTNRNFKTEGALTDKKYVMITVSGFQNYAQAMDYRRKFISSAPVRNSTGAKMTTFVIGGENLRRFLEDRNYERYEIFFNENFLNTTSSGLNTSSTGGNQ